MTREKWFERRFEFAFPASRFPDVLERLRGTPARLEDRTASLSRDILVRREGEAWSIQENVGHLLDLEPLWLRRAEQFFDGQAELAPADLSNRTTREADHNRAHIDDLLSKFRAARMRLVARLSPADEAMVIRTAIHPRLKVPMRLIDHAFFVAEHDDHHLATITQRLESL